MGPSRQTTCEQILIAIREAVERLPGTTKDNPWPAANTHLVVVHPSVDHTIVDMLLSKRRVTTVLSQTMQLGYESIQVINSETELVFMLAGRN